MLRPFRRSAVAPLLLLVPLAAITAAVLRPTVAQEGESAKQEQADRQVNAADVPQAVVDTHELMHLFNQPLYRYLKEAMQQQPAADPQWTTIAERGWQAAEVANLVALRKDDGHWRQLASDLQQAGIHLAKTAETHRWEPTQQAYRQLLQRCNDCHQQVAPQHAPQLQP